MGKPTNDPINQRSGAKTGLNVEVAPTLETNDFQDFMDKYNYDLTNMESFLSHTYGQSYPTNRYTSIAESAPFSLGNRYALYTWFGLHGAPHENVAQYYRDSTTSVSNGGNRIASPYYTKEPTCDNIIQFFSEMYGGMEYAWSDFLWCKYNNKIPNNYMVTLRRFAMPCEDNIYNIKKTVLRDTKEMDEDGYPIADVIDLTSPDIARAITWMGDQTGNTYDDLLTFSYGYNYKEQTAETNTYQSTDEGYTAQPFYTRMGAAGKSMFDVVKGVKSGEKYAKERTSGHDPLKETWENFVIGPINVINKMQTRDVGLNFDQEITLIFEYDLKGINDLNPRVAFLDIFANLLVLTYSNANFWGGANRFYSANGFVASRFGDTSKLIKGDFRGYMTSVVDEMSVGFKGVFGDSSTGTFTPESIFDGFKSLVGTFLGNMFGSFINKQLGAAPAFQAVKGFISGEPTGNWHITIGNPMNPIAMFGNMILTGSKISFGGPLGYDDFPSSIKLECSLKHARPRDKTDFESAFNAGKGRLYAGSADLADVLNTQGNDVKVYGAFQGSKPTRVEKGMKSGEITSTDIENIVTMSAGKLGFKKDATLAAGQSAGYYSKWANKKAMSELDSYNKFITM